MGLQKFVNFRPKELFGENCIKFDKQTSMPLIASSFKKEIVDNFILSHRVND